MKCSIKLLNLLVFTSFCSLTMAQNGTRFVPNIYLTTGIGIVPTSYNIGKAAQRPLEFGLEYQFQKKISIGAFYGMAAYSSNPTNLDATLDFKTKLIAIRPLAHFGRLKKYDFYGGLMLGLLNQKITTPTDSMTETTKSNMKKQGIVGNKTTMHYSAIIGGKRFIGKRLLVFAEAGFGTSMLTAGVGYNLRN